MCTNGYAVDWSASSPDGLRTWVEAGEVLFDFERQGAPCVVRSRR